MGIVSCGSFVYSGGKIKDYEKRNTMDELKMLILKHTMIGMTRDMSRGDSVLCLCGEQLEGVSAHALHADHLATELVKAGYKNTTPEMKFKIRDRVETYKHDKGEVVGWSIHSSGGVSYRVLISNRGSYTYSEKDLQKA